MTEERNMERHTVQEAETLLARGYMASIEEILKLDNPEYEWHGGTIEEVADVVMRYRQSVSDMLATTRTGG
jgi:hypothetical protein